MRALGQKPRHVGSNRWVSDDEDDERDRQGEEQRFWKDHFLEGGVREKLHSKWLSIATRVFIMYIVYFC